jgi:hypothetical protein
MYPKIQKQNVSIKSEEKIILICLNTSSINAYFRNSISSICCRARVNSVVGSKFSSLVSVIISLRLFDNYPVIEVKPRVKFVAVAEFHQPHIVSQGFSIN